MARRILIVEDQAEIRRLIRWTLEDGDYLVHEAANGQAALQIARTLRPELLLLDVMMPGGISGLDVCREIKGDAELARIKVVVLSASAAAQDRQNAMKAGADAFLGKPFSPVKLQELIERMLAGAAR